MRDVYQWMGRELNGLKNPTRNWNSLQGKRKQESAKTPAKPTRNDSSSWGTIMEGLSCALSSLPSTIWNPGWSETMQGSNWGQEERQVGSVEEYLSKLYCTLQTCLLLHGWLGKCRSFNFEWSSEFLLLLWLHLSVSNWNRLSD